MPSRAVSSDLEAAARILERIDTLTSDPKRALHLVAIRSAIAELRTVGRQRRHRTPDRLTDAVLGQPVRVGPHCVRLTPAALVRLPSGIRHHGSIETDAREQRLHRYQDSA